LAILSEIFIEIGYFFLRVMQENKSGFLSGHSVYYGIGLCGDGDDEYDGELVMR